MYLSCFLRHASLRAFKVRTNIWVRRVAATKSTPDRLWIVPQRWYTKFRFRVGKYILVKLDAVLMTAHGNMNCQSGIKAMHTCQLTVPTVGVSRDFKRLGSWEQAKKAQPEN
ncbi:unnamed protein product [Ixodes persulcatus]